MANKTDSRAIAKSKAGAFKIPRILNKCYVRLGIQVAVEVKFNSHTGTFYPTHAEDYLTLLHLIGQIVLLENIEPSYRFTVYGQLAKVKDGLFVVEV